MKSTYLNSIVLYVLINVYTCVTHTPIKIQNIILDPEFPYVPSQLITAFRSSRIGLEFESVGFETCENR